MLHKESTDSQIHGKSGGSTENQDEEKKASEVDESNFSLQDGDLASMSAFSRHDLNTVNQKKPRDAT
jgi:hypothetical protein